MHHGHGVLHSSWRRIASGIASIHAIQLSGESWGRVSRVLGVMRGVATAGTCIGHRETVIGTVKGLEEVEVMLPIRVCACYGACPTLGVDDLLDIHLGNQSGRASAQDSKTRHCVLIGMGNAWIRRSFRGVVSKPMLCLGNKLSGGYSQQGLDLTRWSRYDQSRILMIYQRFNTCVQKKSGRSKTGNRLGIKSRRFEILSFPANFAGSLSDL